MDALARLFRTPAPQGSGKDEEEETEPSEFTFQEDLKRGTFSVSKILNIKEGGDSTKSRQLNMFLKEKDPENMSEEERLDMFSGVYDILGVSDPDIPTTWLIPSCHIACHHDLHVNLGMPWLGVVLDGSYFNWPDEEATLPVLFAPLGAKITDPVVKNLFKVGAELEHHFEAEKTTFTLSPNIYGVVKHTPFHKSPREEFENSYLILIRSKELANAAAFYARTYQNQSPILNAYASLDPKVGSGAYLLQFTMPKILQKTQYPRLKKEYIAVGVQMKMTMYARDYVGWSHF